jgi:hypothetical protein
MPIGMNPSVRLVRAVITLTIVLTHHRCIHGAVLFDAQLHELCTDTIPNACCNPENPCNLLFLYYYRSFLYAMCIIAVSERLARALQRHSTRRLQQQQQQQQQWRYSRPQQRSLMNLQHTALLILVLLHYSSMTTLVYSVHLKIGTAVVVRAVAQCTHWSPTVVSGTQWLAEVTLLGTEHCLQQPLMP